MLFSCSKLLTISKEHIKHQELLAVHTSQCRFRAVIQNRLDMVRLFVLAVHNSQCKIPEQA